MKTYFEIIRELREDNDLTQSEVAKILGTTQQVYSRYEKGINEIPIRHIITLCNYYNVSADYILYGKRSEQQMSETVAKLSALDRQAYGTVQALIDLLYARK